MRLGVLTGGGDCPGLNAVIRALVRRCEITYQAPVVGFYDGWQGVLDDRSTDLTVEACRGLLTKGGTILGTTRVQPYGVDGGVARAREVIERHRLDAMVVIGGEGSLSAAAELSEDGFAMVGVPKTIDNDIMHTEVSFGFMTAVETATEAIDRLHSTAESHDRVMVVEVMGRHAGHIATWAGLAGGAAITLVPEEPFDIEAVCETIKRRHARGRWATIVVVAEGALPIPGTLDIGSSTKDQFGHVKLGGVSTCIAAEINRRTGIDTKVTILGYVQRGGTPNAFDRVLCTWLGVAAADAVRERAFGTMVSLQKGVIARVPLADVKGGVKQTEPALLALRQLFSS